MQKLLNSEDHKNWESFLEGDRVAFANLYKQHAEGLFKYGFKMTSNVELIRDSINELFIDLWNQRAQLSRVLKPKNYLIKAFRYKLLAGKKKETQFEKVYPINEEVTSSIETEWISNEEQLEQINILYRSIDVLPDRQREVIHLKYLQNLSTKEIAEILDINPQSVTNLLVSRLNQPKKKSF